MVVLAYPSQCQSNIEKGHFVYKAENIFEILKLKEVCARLTVLHFIILILMFVKVADWILYKKDIWIVFAHAKIDA